MIHFFGLSTKDIDVEVNKTKSKEHAYIENYIHEQLVQKKFVGEARDYHNFMKQLKRFRVESDYHEILALSDTATIALTYCDRVLSILNTVFL